MVLLVSLVVPLVAFPEVSSLTEEPCDPPLAPLDPVLLVDALEPVVWVDVVALELAPVVVPPLPPVPLVDTLVVPPAGPVVAAKVPAVDVLVELVDEAPVLIGPTLFSTGSPLEAVEHASTNVEQTILTVAKGKVKERTFLM